jgi:hypothetical protein
MGGIARGAATYTRHPGKTAAVYRFGFNFGEMGEIKIFPVY